MHFSNDKTPLILPLPSPTITSPPIKPTNKNALSLPLASPTIIKPLSLATNKNALSLPLSLPNDKTALKSPTITPCNSPPIKPLSLPLSLAPLILILVIMNLILFFSHLFLFSNIISFKKKILITEILVCACLIKKKI
eukprot:484363_1